MLNNSMKILFLGDIVGRPARAFLKGLVPNLKKELALDLIIANGENLAHGKGITEKCLKEIEIKWQELKTHPEKFHGRLYDDQFIQPMYKWLIVQK